MRHVSEFAGHLRQKPKASHVQQVGFDTAKVRHCWRPASERGAGLKGGDPELYCSYPTKIMVCNRYNQWLMIDAE